MAFFAAIVLFHFKNYNTRFHEKRQFFSPKIGENDNDVHTYIDGNFDPRERC
jgi:hypothetical protein